MKIYKISTQILTQYLTFYCKDKMGPGEYNLRRNEDKKSKINHKQLQRASKSLSNHHHTQE